MSQIDCDADIAIEFFLLESGLPELASDGADEQ
jgi:hypothetical protein